MHRLLVWLVWQVPVRKHLNPDDINDVGTILDSIDTLDESGERSGSILIDKLIEPGVLVVCEFGLYEYWAAEELKRDNIESCKHIPCFSHNFIILGE